MDTKWLEDFVSLAETQSFSRSASLRNVTQPAFSRRIQSLEAWLGTELIDRSSYPTRLTPAGHVFYEQALAMLAQIGETRELLRGQSSGQGSMIDFAVPHNLSLTFFPRWLSQIEQQIGRLPCRLRALNVHDAVLTLVEGGCDLMMCYHHARQPVQLDPLRYDMLPLGVERLAPYSIPDASGRAQFGLLGDGAVPYLAYAPGAFLGRVVDTVLTELPRRPALDKVYETDMAEALKAMALAGHGVAFLPDKAVREEVLAGRLVRADHAPDVDYSVEVELRLYRQHPDGQGERPTTQAPRRALVDRIWQALSQSR